MYPQLPSIGLYSEGNTVRLSWTARQENGRMRKAGSLCHHRDECVSRAGSLAPTLMQGQLSQDRINRSWAVWSHTRGKQTGRLDASMFMASSSDFYPGGCTLTSLLLQSTRLHVKLCKASDLAENPTRVVHFHWDLNLGGRKLSALPWWVRV